MDTLGHLQRNEDDAKKRNPLQLAPRLEKGRDAEAVGEQHSTPVTTSENAAPTLRP